MAERILLLTGHLAEPRLKQMMNEFGREGLDWEIADIGVKVAALMTEEIIRRRLPRPVTARPGDPARTGARRPRSPRGGVRCALRARPRRDRGHPDLFRARRTKRPIFRSMIRGSSRRSSTLPAAPIESILDRARAMRTARCRRDRPRRPAGHAISRTSKRRSRRSRRRASRSASIPAISTRSRTRRWRGRRLSPQPRREQSRSRRRSRGDPGHRAGAARRPRSRLSGPARSSTRRACHISPIRCSIRSISASWNHWRAMRPFGA